MKAPTKAELREQIKALTRENANLKRQLTKEKHKKWQEKSSQALSMLYRKIPYLPREMHNTTLDQDRKSVV